jgi:ATP-dependent exoDNAse (exonuclease V) beta subunit
MLSTMLLVGLLPLSRIGTAPSTCGNSHFDDLLHHARDLLANDPGVRQALPRRYPRILVDEFQDTDPLQAEILWLLCGDGDESEPWAARRLRPGSLFLVGDP